MIRTAAYCRVSTEREEQEGSYETQMTYFKKKIESKDEWELVGVYGDYGKTGLKVKGRQGLNQLIKDCESGLIDQILVKSVSRFARNMADCLELINKLKKLGVTIYFERENINTNELKCELILQIFAALAQEESNSISQNVRRWHEQSASEGRPACGKITYGYRRNKDATWVVHEEEARRVRTAFMMAAEGSSYPKIMETLNSMEKEEHTGKVWQQRTIRKLLRNVQYLGDYVSHRNVCLVPGREVENKGYRDQYYIEEHHEPLVTKAVFDRVQEMVDKGILISYLPITEEKIRILENRGWKTGA